MHRDHGGGIMWPHLSSNGGASYSGRWSWSWWSYVRDGLGGGAAVVACSVDEGTVATTRCGSLLWRCEQGRKRVRARVSVGEVTLGSFSLLTWRHGDTAGVRHNAAGEPWRRSATMAGFEIG